MQFNLNDTQTMIQDGARRFLQESLDPEKVREVEESADGFAVDLWTQMTELGWTGAALPEDVGGGGLGRVDLCVLSEELGRAAASLPLAETAGFAATALQAVDQSPLVHDLLKQMATSDTVITPALAEPGGRDERTTPKCLLKDGKVSGAKVMAPFASFAKILLVSCVDEQGQIALAAIDREASGVSLNRHKVMGGDPLFRVDLEDVDVSPDRILARGQDAEHAINAGLDVATMLSIAEVVGNCESMIDLSTELAINREQFGQKIGSFQAVAHPIADMRINTDACRLLIAEAAWKLDKGNDAVLEIAETKVFANEVVVDMLHAAHAVHGAIGYTMEYDLQLHTRRGRAFCLSYGDTDSQVERAAQALGL